MELRDIEVFLAVVKFGHFRRAAESLGINQSQVSRTIDRLEQDLGTRLLNRTTRLVSLTPAGTALVPELLKTLQSAIGARALAKEMARAATNSLNIAAISSLPFIPFFADILRSFRQTHPSCNLIVNELGVAQQVAGLLDGSIDAGFARLPILGEYPSELIVSGMHAEPLLLAIPEGHALLRDEAIDVRDVKHVPLITYSADIGGGLYELTNQICERAGFHASAAQVVFRVPMALSLVAAGLGVAFVPAGVARMPVPGLAFRPLKDPEAVAHIGLLRRATERSTIVRRFLDMAMSWRNAAAGSD